MAYKDQTKSSKKIIIAALAVCIALVLFVLYVLVFADMIRGAKTRNEVFEALTFANELTLTDPLYDGDILPTSAQAYITGDEADALADELVRATEGARFGGLKSGKAGFWDISVYFESDGKIYTAYLTEDSFYVTKGDIGYIFTPKDSDSYAAMYQKVEYLIADRVGN